MLQTMNNYVDDNLEYSQIGKTEAHRSNAMSKSTNYPIDKASEQTKFQRNQNLYQRTQAASVCQDRRNYSRMERVYETQE